MVSRSIAAREIVFLRVAALSSKCMGRHNCRLWLNLEMVTKTSARRYGLIVSCDVLLRLSQSCIAAMDISGYAKLACLIYYVYVLCQNLHWYMANLKYVRCQLIALIGSDHVVIELTVRTGPWTVVVRRWCRPPSRRYRCHQRQSVSEHSFIRLIIIMIFIYKALIHNLSDYIIMNPTDLYIPEPSRLPEKPIKRRENLDSIFHCL